MEWLELKECSICCDDLQENDKVYKLPCKCEYVYHDSCIEQHFEEEKKRHKKTTCPLCSSQITYDYITTTTYSTTTSYDWVTLDGRE